MNISLKYANLTLGVPTWSSSVDFDALEFFEKPAVERTSAEMLNGEMTTHVKSSRNIWMMTISADELIDSAKAAFMDLFYTAGGPWKFSDDNWSTETIVVIEETGDLPSEFLNNNKYLKEIKFKLIQKSGT